MKRKIMVGLLVVVLMLSVTACRNSDAPFRHINAIEIGDVFIMGYLPEIAGDFY